ncbi:MAG: MBL fold metallo-hydrolase [Casimicrobiaceae bacterium]
MWLVRGTRRNVLIDSGLPTTFDLLCAALADAGLRPDDLDLVVLSHEHIDHAGGAVQLARYCPIAAHRLAANKLALRDEFTVMSRAFAAQIDAGLEKLHALLDDSHALFSALRDTGRGHDDVMRSLRDLNSL